MKALRLIAVVASILLGGIFVWVKSNSEKPFDELKEDIEYALELITKRQLSEEEIERATREYYALFDNRCGARCIAVTKANNERVKPMKTSAGEPADLLARQYYSRALYFSPTQAGSFIQQLTNEVDPIVLADPGSSQIMTRADIIGAMNIDRFVRDEGHPINHTFSLSEIDGKISHYRSTFVNCGLRLPYRAVFAAELWAGLYQNWRDLDSNQQLQVKYYFSDRHGTANMSISIYRILLGVSDDAAADWQRTFIREQRHARLEAVSHMTMMGTVAKTVGDSETYWRW